MRNLPKSLFLNKNTNNIDLIIHGQCVFMFKVSNNTQEVVFSLKNPDNTNNLFIKFNNKRVAVYNSNLDQTYIDNNNKYGLIDNDDAIYWFSLDSQNQILRAGIGEARPDTIIYDYKFSYTFKDEDYEKNKIYLESFTNLTYHENIQPIKLLRDPIVSNVPLKVKSTNELTMNDVAENKYLPHSNLSQTAQQLYDCISGKKFVLDDDDFPDFSKAIEYSIATPGLWCHEKLKDKSTEFNPSKPNINETYLRITLGKNSGESPGIPYVLEIWPSNHFSPIHSHAATDAIIRVLHGEINVKLFPFLSKKEIKPFGTKVFKKDEVTWISPELNQVHQLINLNKDATCITIQCYMYGEKNRIHYDYFDFVSEDGHLEQYEPDSDMDFVDFKILMKKEWNEKP